LLDNFTEGDTVMLRFRLFSDPFSNGWGWVIDDLLIQTEKTITSSESVVADPIRLRVYPNPADSHISLHFDVREQRDVRLKIYDVNGQLVWRGNRQLNGKGGDTFDISISHLIPGIYFIQAGSGDVGLRAKFLVK